MIQSENEWKFARENLRNKNLVVVHVLVATIKFKVPSYDKQSEYILLGEIIFNIP